MQSNRKVKLAHVIGCDFDDCLLPNNGADIHLSNRHLLSIWKRQGERAYQATYFYSSSNRQSWAVDNGNRQNDDQTLLTDPTSSFLPVKALAEQELKCTFWSYLLADAYAERPFGYSYAKAISRAKDDTAYHPGYVFDESKFSLIYAQTHFAANNMRNCDFLSLVKRPNDLQKFPIKSNAAYIYIQSEQVLLYVNKIESHVYELKIKNRIAFDEMLARLNETIQNQEHDFEMFCQDDIFIQGITLSATDLKTMESIGGHLHRKKDYPIIFDFYDDREDILRGLTEAYTKISYFLPRNLIFRSNLYSANEPDKIYEFSSIIGTGDIDTRPGESIINMAKLVLQKDELTEDDYLIEGCSFANGVENIIAGDYFKNRSLVKPQVGCEEENKLYAIHDLFSCVLFPKEIVSIKEFLEDKKTYASYAQIWGKVFNQNPLADLYYNPVIQSLSSLLSSQTKNDLLRYFNQLFAERNRDVYIETIGENSDMDVFLRNTHSFHSNLDKKKDEIQHEKDFDDINSLLDKAITGIEFYQELPRTVCGSHLGFFAAIFDNERGLLRANAYHSLLSGENTKTQKCLSLLALLYNTDGVELKRQVCNSIGLESSEVKSTLISYLSRQDEKTELNTQHKKVINKIIDRANNSPVDEIKFRQ